MGRNDDDRVKDWSSCQRRSQRARGDEHDKNPPRKEEPKTRRERPDQNTSQPRGDTAGQNTSRRDGVETRDDRGNQELQRKEHARPGAERKPREGRDNKDPLPPPRKGDSKNRSNRDGQNVSRKNESRLRCSGDTTEQYTIEYRENRRRRQMVPSDSDSDSESAKHPKRRLRKNAGDRTDETTNGQRDQSSSKVASSRRTHSTAVVGGVLEKSPKQPSPEKKPRQHDKIVEGKPPSDMPDRAVIVVGLPANTGQLPAPCMPAKPIQLSAAAQVSPLFSFFFFSFFLMQIS